jgi:hypothetical protein
MPRSLVVSYNLDRLHELDDVGVVGFKCFVATCGDAVSIMISAM